MASETRREGRRHHRRQDTRHADLHRRHARRSRKPPHRHRRRFGGFQGTRDGADRGTDRKRGQTLRRMRGHRPDDYDEVRGPHHEEVRAENHRVAQCADGRRHGHVRRLPRDGRRPDALHVRRRPGVQRPRGRFRRGDAPAGHVPHPGAARRGDRGRARGRTRM